MSWTLLTDAEGEPLPFDGPTELVPGSELRQAGSHTALLRSGSRTLFVKKATQDMVAKKEWNDRRRVLLYIRNELRFYAEFAGICRAAASTCRSLITSPASTSTASKRTTTSRRSTSAAG